MTRVQILNSSGKLIGSPGSWVTNKMEVSSLSPGLYIVRVRIADGSVENANVVVQ